MDKKRIEAAVREILAAVGEDPDREGLVETPERVARMYEEIFSGLEDDPKRHVKLFNEEKTRNWSLCATYRCIPCASTIFCRLSAGRILHISRATEES